MTWTAILSQLTGGMVNALKIFSLTLLFSLPLGLLISFLRMSKNTVVRTIAKLYISIMRGTPLMLQLMVVYFGPYYIFKINTTDAYRFQAVIIGFVLNYAAYFAEIYRGGIESMPRGQYEASKLLGYNRIQTFFIVIFPQVIKRILPSITNEIITLVKDTSLAFVISYQEMFTKSKALASAQGNVMPFIVAGVSYYVFNLLMAFIMEKAEKKLSYYR